MTTVNTICLCGSTRFVEDFQIANIELTKRGYSVITISMAMPRQPDGSHEENGLKEVLDLVHLNKILRADAVFIVGTGYIGRSTAREILWAQMQGKPIFWQTAMHGWDHLAIEMRHPIHIDGHGGVDRAHSVLGFPAAFASIGAP